MPHHHTPTSLTRLATLLTLTILAILLAACGNVIKDSEEHQAIQDYASACASTQEVLSFDLSNWGEATELFERQYQQTQSLDAPASLHQFHQTGLALPSTALQFALARHPSETYNSSRIVNDPSFHASLIDYFVAWDDLSEDVRDILIQYECLPQAELSGDRDELEAVQEYASACGKILDTAPKNVWPLGPARATWGRVTTFAEVVTKDIKPLGPPSVLSESHDVFVNYWSEVLDAVEGRDPDQRPEGLTSLMPSTGAERQLTALSQTLQKLPHDVFTLLQLNRCIL